MKKVIGIDEVGRGAWAGPLVVGAVLLAEKIPGLNDSKKLTKAQRIRLAQTIHHSALFVGLGWVSASEVDDLGLTQATSLACERALENAPLGVDIIIDGSVNYLPNRKNCTILINGDALEPAISAASIVAKVARDEFMAQQDDMFEGYNFASHVGYGTRAHLVALQKNGLTPIHRWSYKPLKRMLDEYET